MSNRPGGSCNVRVAVRARPLLPKERIQKCRNVIRVDGNQVSLDGSRVFAYDHAFPGPTSQQRIYEVCVEPLVSRVFDGFNSTVFAYGQTGSGKTHTMMGTSSSTGEEEDISIAEDDLAGVIPRVIWDLFRRIEEAELRQTRASEGEGGVEEEGESGSSRSASDSTTPSGTKVSYRVRVTCLELYNDSIRDLLATASGDMRVSRQSVRRSARRGAGRAVSAPAEIETLAIREDSHHRVFVVGAVEEECVSRSEMLRTVQLGFLHRTTGETLLNMHSSRSHAVVTIFLDKIMTPESSLEDDDASESGESGGSGGSGGEAVCTTTMFNLVDLAGSERAKKSGAVGQRFKEAVHINRGLLALGKVISELGTVQKRRRTHISYRDSKLTRLLQDSLGGNSNTVMICCVSPSDGCYNESLSALSYAHRTRNIKNKPVANIATPAARIRLYKGKIAKLEAQLEQAMRSMEHRSVGEEMERLRETEVRLTHQVTQLKDTRRRLEEENGERDHRLQQLTQVAFEMEMDRDQRAQKIAQVRRQLELLCEQEVRGSGTFAADVLSHSVSKGVGHSSAWSRAIQAVIDSIQLSQNATRRTRIPTPPLVQSSSPRHLVVRSTPRSLSSPARQHKRRRPPDMKTDPDETEPTGEKPVGEETEAREDEGEATANVSELEQTRSVLAFQTKHLQEIEGKLVEAQQDLLRDVAIFANKNKTIRRLRDENAVIKERLRESGVVLEGEGEEDVDEEEGEEVEDGEMSVSLQSALPTAMVRELEEEKKRILAEKERIERERLAYIAKTEEQERTFRAKQRTAEARLQDLSEKINEKETLISELIASEEQAMELKDQYEGRIEALNVEILRMQEEEKTSEIQRRRQVTSLLKQKRRELVDMKRKHVASETSRKRNEVHRMKQLRGELQRMKVQERDLKKRMNTEAARNSEKVSQFRRVVSRLKRKQEASDERIRRLQVSNRRTRAVLKKKRHELIVTKKQLRRNKDRSERYRLFMRREKAKLEQQIEQFVHKKEAMSRLQRELRKREGLLRQREEMQQSRQRLHVRLTKKTNVMRESMAGLMMARLRESQASGMPGMDMEELIAERAEAEHEVGLLERQTETDADQLKDMDEKLEVLDSHLKYEDGEILRVQEEMDRRKRCRK